MSVTSLPASTTKAGAHLPWMDRALAFVATRHAKGILDRLMDSAKHARQVQERVLLQKLRRNARSDLGRNLGFEHIHSADEFVRKVPVKTYEDLAPYVEQVKAGNLGAMFGPRERVLMFAKTSGTTATPKYVPVTDAFLKEYRRGWNAFGGKAIGDHPATLLRPILQISSPMDEEISSGGIPCGAITGIMARTQKQLVRRYYIVPQTCARIVDAQARYYTIMRFAAPGDVSFAITASPATLLKLARAADENAERLIRDVRDGTICAEMEIDAEVRDALAPHLRPDPAAADRLEKIASRTNRLLPRDYWDLGFLANWTGGTMRLYLRNYPEYFGRVPVRDVGLLASEGRMSIPLEDGTAAGLLDVDSHFFEFIPSDAYGEPNPPTLRCHELEVGREYFIVMTTSAGFYRYDIGDRVRVTGYYGEAPFIEFLHKGLHMSSLSGEKLTEQQVVLAYDRTLDETHAPRRHFVLAPQWDDPPCYCLHVEAGKSDGAGRPVCPDHDEALVATFDRALCDINVEYESKRSSGRLGPVRINLLPPDWLVRHDQRLAAATRGVNEQYKHRYLYSAIDEDAEFPRSHHT